jgi:hypothetical protein
MSQWTEAFKNHPVWELLEKLGPEIEKAIVRDAIEPLTIEMLARMKGVLTFTGKRLSGADPYILVSAILDNLSESLALSIQEIQNFNVDGDAQHVLTANLHADAVLNYLAQLNIPLTTEDFIAAKEAAELYRSGLEKVLLDIKTTSSPLQAEINSLRQMIASLTSQLNDEQARLAALSTDYQKQFSTTQEARANEFAVSQKERQDIFTTLQNEFMTTQGARANEFGASQKERQDKFTVLQAEFMTAQEARANDFAAAQKERQDRYTTLFTEFSQKLTEQNTEFSKQREDIVRLHKDELELLKKEFAVRAENLHEEIVKRKIEVEKLVGVIGNLGVTSGYLKTANEAKVTVRVWQGIAVVAMIGFIALASFAILPAIKEGGFSWPGLVGRVFVSITAGVLSAYAASQADKYQKMERQNRRLALELEAIGPFIAPLDEGDQKEFRIKMGDRTFCRGDEADMSSDAKSPATSLDVLLESKAVQSFVASAIKAGKADS